MNKYSLHITTSCRKDIKKIKKRGYDMKKMDIVVDMLLKGESLPVQYSDHALSGNWKGYRECHISPDWLLVYEFLDDVLVLSLSATGSHSDIFGK